MSNLGYYVGLLEDHRRIDAFARAIRSVVRPEDHVVEIGCGVATYSLLAARAGARRVTAIDQDAVAIALAREIGVERLSEGRITLIESPVEAVVLDEPADVVIFEDFGSIVFRPGLRSLLEHVRTRMARPGARWIPGGIEMFLAPLELEVRTLSAADPGPLPFPPEALALLRKRGLNDMNHKEFGPERLAGPGVPTGRFTMGDPYPVRTRLAGRTSAARDSRATALTGWMRLHTAPGIALDNSPVEKRVSWNLGVFPFEEPLDVRAGEPLDLEMEIAHGPGTEGLLYRWSLGGPAGRREGSSVNALPGDLAALRRGSLEDVPQASPRISAVRRALAEVGGAGSVAEIARVVYDSHRDVFADARAVENLLLVVFDRLKGTAVK